MEIWALLLYEEALMEIQQVTSLLQAVNKAYTVTWCLLEPIVHNLLSLSFLFNSVNKDTTYKKNDTGQTVSCWHHSDLDIILPLWNPEKACRLLVQFWKEVGEAKAKQDSLQWNAPEKIFQPVFKFLKHRTDLLTSFLTTETTTKNIGLDLYRW